MDPDRPRRIDSIDLVRGLVMLFMVLDHCRDFVHRDGLGQDPTDPATTTPVLYFTRFVTHFCAPTFVLLAGVAARLQASRGVARERLAGFLLRRGVFLVLLEVVVLRPLMWFDLDYSFAAHLQVIWAIGWSMCGLALLVRLGLPPIAIGGLGLLVVVAHDLVPYVRYSQAPLLSWRAVAIVLLQRGGIELGSGSIAFVQYAVLPWFGIMLCGYWIGALFGHGERTRRRALLAIGVVAGVAFVVLRATGGYGDHEPWDAQSTAWRSLFSFLRVEKYPPSLQFVLMTLGPSLLALAFAERVHGRVADVVVAIGRVPLFYYVLQWPLVHLASRLLQWLDGQPVGWEAVNPLRFSGTLPDGCGFTLRGVYLAWLLCLAVMVPASVAFARWKRANAHRRWLHYL